MLLTRGVVRVRAVLGVAALICGTSAWLVAPACHQIVFDAATWRSAHSDRQLRQRERMVSDLVSRLRPGMPRRDIEALLGAPERVWTPEPPEPRPVAQYDMGHAPMDMAGQHDLLRLHFDAADRLASAEVTRD